MTAVGSAGIPRITSRTSVATVDSDGSCAGSLEGCGNGSDRPGGPARSHVGRFLALIPSIMKAVFPRLAGSHRSRGSGKSLERLVTTLLKVRRELPRGTTEENFAA